jgi:hypothetical protein
LFLIFVMVLASCSSFAGNTQSPSPAPGVSTTQAPASEVEAAWKTYTNAEVGFSIQYPADWQQQDLPDENEGQMHRIALQGSEGGMELIWGVGLGGAYPAGYQPMAVAQGTLSACHTQREDGTELWSLAGQPVGDKPTSPVAMRLGFRTKRTPNEACTGRLDACAFFGRLRGFKLVPQRSVASSRPGGSRLSRSPVPRQSTPGHSANR